MVFLIWTKMARSFGERARSARFRSRARKFAAATAVALLLAPAAPGIASGGSANAPEPDSFNYLDGNSVDLATAEFKFSHPVLSIGPMELSRTNRNAAWNDTWQVRITRTPSDRGSPPRWIVEDGGASYSFLPLAGSSSYFPEQKDGSSLTLDSAQNRLVFVDGRGTVIEFPTLPGIQNAVTRYAIFKVLPNGERFDFHNRHVQICHDPVFCNGYSIYDRRQSVVSSAGWYLKFHYVRNNATTLAEGAEFVTQTEVIGANMAYVYCNPAADTCSIPAEWPRASFAYSGPQSARVEAFTDPANQTHHFTRNNGNLVGVRLAGQSTNTLTVDYNHPTAPPGERYVGVRSVTAAGQTWFYSFMQAVQEPEVRVGSVTAPDGGVRNLVVELGYRGSGRPYRDRDQLNRETTFDFGIIERSLVPKLMSATFPEGNGVSFTYDDRGNILTRTALSKPGSGLSPSTWSATFPATCPNRKTCNQPVTATDPLGRTSHYDYSGIHGSLVEERSPAVNGVMPDVRYVYEQRHAWVRNSAGAFVQSSPIWLLTETRRCRTSANTISGCTAGPTDEVRTLYDYGPNSGPNNLLLRGMVEDANGAALRTCYGYDKFGNKISETRPRAGLASCS